MRDAAAKKRGSRTATMQAALLESDGPQELGWTAELSPTPDSVDAPAMPPVVGSPVRSSAPPNPAAPVRSVADDIIREVSESQTPGEITISAEEVGSQLIGRQSNDGSEHSSLSRDEAFRGGDVWDCEPVRLNVEDIQQVLVWGARNGVSDTYVQSGFPLRAKVKGHICDFTERRLEVPEVMEIARSISPGAEKLLMDGKDADCRYDFSPSKTERYMFRVNMTRGCERGGGNSGIELTLRTIPKNIPTMDDLEIEGAIRSHAFPEEGVVLITGPTGSGKSTLLASLLAAQLQRDDKRMLTYEAPPEYPLMDIPGMKGMCMQHEVGHGAHIPSFADGVRNALRRDPDIILIGEARDADTVSMVLRAAETGHTVYTTVHTRGVLNTWDRMVDEYPMEARWGQKVKLINATRLIVNQRLFKKPGGGRTALRSYMPVTEDMREKLLEGGPDRFDRLMRDFMAERGQSLLQDAETKFSQGRLDKATLLELRASEGVDSHGE